MNSTIWPSLEGHGSLSTAFEPLLEFNTRGISRRQSGAPMSRRITGGFAGREGTFTG